MKRLMGCPKCKHTQFIRKSYDLVEIEDDGECMIDNEINVRFEEPIYVCRNCGEDVTEEEMIVIDELGKLILNKLK